MKKFLDILAEELINKYGEKLSNNYVVFPSRRACIYFKKELSQKISKPAWAPFIAGIQDFVAMHSPFNIADKLELIFELYECYRSEANDETFDKFYPWGNMLLGDFDEIDRNLVEADHLFRVLREHKEVEKEFGFSAEESAEFNRFWKSFSNKELTRQQEEFINTWEIMGRVYHLFRKRLIRNNICYEGMAYRSIYEMVKSKDFSFNYDKIIFAGFNQLNRAEELIIKELIKRDSAEIYWDSDSYYTDNKEQEAGKFLRHNFAALGDNKRNWINGNLKSTEKEITIVGAALKTGQAKALGHLLKNYDADQDETVVVLPDESILLPVLHSIPEEISELNVTMGYPFRYSSLFNFLNSLRNLHKNSKDGMFYHKDCIELLSHPFINRSSESAFLTAINEIKNRNIIYLTSTRLLSISGNEKILSDIFRNVSSSDELLKYIYELIPAIAAGLDDKNSRDMKFEREFLFALYQKLNLMKNLFSKYEVITEVPALLNIIIEMMSVEKIPFTGEPLKGLQVMGLLETRSLDFKNVFILSMNEGTVPSGNTQSSYIPYHLRRAFRIPTYEDDDAAFAYYFYRLISRASNVFLIHNTESTGLLSGEKSRFVQQVEYELPEVNKKVKINTKVFQASPGMEIQKDIVIEKSPEIMEQLKQRKYSASALSEYITCSLKFYLKRIAGLKTEGSVEEAFSGAAFGNLLHEIMSQLYSGLKNKTISAEDIKAVKAGLDEKFDETWGNACGKITELREFAKEVYGKNLLFKNVIKKLVGLILKNDIEQAPFRILDIEGKLETELEAAHNTLSLTGRLDRVEEKDGIIRIIDYKTGLFDMRKQGSKSVEDFFEKVFTDPDYKEAFQQYFYAMMYNKLNPGSKINIGIYPLKSISGGISFYENKNSYISIEKFNEFAKKLDNLFAEILDPNQQFKKTDDTERCKYCDYVSLCYRE